jgi:hypothetical protein
MPRLKTRKALRGGGVPYLNKNRFGYTGFQSMMNDLSLYTISAHGETTADKYFLVVPEKTYIVFSARSGKSAYSGIEEVTPYISYGSKESPYDYYTKLYKQLFMPIETRKIAGIPQLEDGTYIYEPGDIIPDYKLFFKNMPNFIFMHGIYSLPIRSISGPNAPRSSEHWGQTKSIIKMFLNEDKLTADDLNDLDPRDKADILERTPKELETGYYIYSPKKIYESKAMKVINDDCCNNNPDNLVLQPPMSKKLLLKQNNELRMSYVLKTMPLQEGTTRRFFFCHFCRVSFDEYLTSLKVLLRTASFSGKCSSAQDRSKGFNMFRLAIEFCKLPPILKDKLLKTETGIEFIKFLKKVVREPPGSTWAECIPEEFIEAVKQDYVGALEADDLITILGMSITISRMITKFNSDINRLKVYLSTVNRTNVNLQDRIQTRERLVVRITELLGILKEFFKPIKEFHLKYSTISNKTYEESSIRARLARKLYQKINIKLTTAKLKLTKDDGEYLDPLNFRTSAIWILEVFNERFDANEYNDKFAEINTAMMPSMDKDDEDIQSDLILELGTQFSFYMGVAPIPANNRTRVLPFVVTAANTTEPVAAPNVAAPNVAAPNVAAPPPPAENANGEEEEVRVVTNEANLGLGGGRRKTRRRKRRLISKK